MENPIKPPFSYGFPMVYLKWRQRRQPNDRGEFGSTNSILDALGTLRLLVVETIEMGVRPRYPLVKPEENHRKTIGKPIGKP